jgi:hypothetical protein
MLRENWPWADNVEGVTKAIEVRIRLTAISASRSASAGTELAQLTAAEKAGVDAFWVMRSNS